MLNVVAHRFHQFPALVLYNFLTYSVISKLCLFFLQIFFGLHASRIIWRATSTLASLADHEEPHDVSVACSTLLYGGMLCNPPGLTRVSRLHASALRLIRIQSGFNPHPEVD